MQARLPFCPDRAPVLDVGFARPGREELRLLHQAGQHFITRKSIGFRFIAIIPTSMGPGLAWHKRKKLTLGRIHLSLVPPNSVETSRISLLGPGGKAVDLCCAFGLQWPTTGCGDQPERRQQMCQNACISSWLLRPKPKR